MQSGYEADVLRLLDTLRCHVGTSITLLVSPADKRNPETVILNGAVTGWRDQAFGGATLLDALNAAHEFTQAAQAHGRIPPADIERLLAVEIEVDAVRRIASRLVAERRRQIEAGRDAAADDKHIGGELTRFASRLLHLFRAIGCGGRALAQSQARQSPEWWQREAAYHALKFTDEPIVLLEHAAAALIAEIGRRERAGA